MTAPPAHALVDSDFTGKLDLAGLPPGQRIFYEVRFLDLADLQTLSLPVTGSFATPPATRRAIRFLWSADTAGQGWGINPDFGGMRIYETMRQTEPDFFIHSGDTIYADNPIQAEQAMPDGGIWRNLTSPAKSKVAETLAEFRGNYVYNLQDDNLRRFNAAVPMLAQWDDHEVTDNWYWELGRTRTTLPRGAPWRCSRRGPCAPLPGLCAGSPSPARADRIFRAFPTAPRSRSSASI
ncbi:MAG: alkaline phosphatase D family protein [Geminicoccaceae bacterium]